MKPSISVKPAWSATLGDWVGCAAWSPDGSTVAVGSLAGEAIVLDARTGAVTAKLAEHPLGVSCLAWSPAGLLGSGGHDGVVRLARVRSSEAPVTLASVPFGRWIAGLAWSPTDPLLAVAAGRSLCALDAEGAAVANWEDLPSTVTAVSWSVGGKVSTLGAACYGGVWWYRPQEPEAPPRHLAYKGSMLTLDVAPNGRWAASGCQDGSVHIWRLWSGDDLTMSGYPSKVEHVAFQDSSEWMAVGNGPEVTVWDFRGKGPGGRAPKVLSGHEGTITALAYQHRGPLLATGDDAGRILLWDPTKSKRPIQAGVSPMGGASLTWSPDDCSLLVGGAAGQVLCLQVAS